MRHTFVHHITWCIRLIPLGSTLETNSGTAQATGCAGWNTHASDQASRPRGHDALTIVSKGKCTRVDFRNRSDAPAKLLSEEYSCILTYRRLKGESYKNTDLVSKVQVYGAWATARSQIHWAGNPVLQNAASPQEQTSLPPNGIVRGSRISKTKIILTLQTAHRVSLQPSTTSPCLWDRYALAN